MGRAISAFEGVELYDGKLSRTVLRGERAARPRPTRCINMNEIEEIQNWYHSQCNEDWEHGYGLKIETLDNPGWSVKIDLVETDLEGVEYSEYSYGVGDSAETSADNWLITKVENNQFVGYGGPHKLQEIFSIFIKWVRSNA